MNKYSFISQCVATNVVAGLIASALTTLNDLKTYVCLSTLEAPDHVVASEDEELADGLLSLKVSVYRT